jgi:hypothetical protein
MSQWSVKVVKRVYRVKRVLRSPLLRRSPFPLRESQPRDISSPAACALSSLHSTSHMHGPNPAVSAKSACFRSPAYLCSPGTSPTLHSHDRPSIGIPWWCVLLIAFRKVDLKLPSSVASDLMAMTYDQTVGLVQLGELSLHEPKLLWRTRLLPLQSCKLLSPWLGSQCGDIYVEQAQVSYSCKKSDLISQTCVSLASYAPRWPSLCQLRPTTLAMLSPTIQSSPL